jgi:hypothetical protein
LRKPGINIGVAIKRIVRMDAFIGPRIGPVSDVQGLKRNTLITRNNLLRQLREQEREVIFDPALGRFVIE